jgi:hypothetical protein
MHARPNKGSGRIPDFYLVGHGKSGTTALYTMLAHHPQLFVGVKEPRYFATEMYERDIPRPRQTPTTLEAYEAWFSGAAPEQIVGDISPWYLWSHEAAHLIAEARPDARIIAILREPASFLASLHRQWLQLYVETETDFRKAMALEGPRSQGRELPLNTYWPKAILYSDHVRYVDQLRRYHALFPRDQVLVLIYDDYRRDNDATLRTILRFLEVDDTVAIANPQVNTSVQVRSPRLMGLLRTFSVGESTVARAVKRSVTALTPMHLRQRALQATRKHIIFGEVEKPDEQFLAELRHRFKGEIVALSEYLDRDLVSLWGYDDID